MVCVVSQKAVDPILTKWLSSALLRHSWHGIPFHVRPPSYSVVLMLTVSSMLLSAQTNTTPWFWNLASQGQLASNAFSFYLSRQPDPTITSEVRNHSHASSIAAYNHADNSCASAALIRPSFKEVCVDPTTVYRIGLTRFWEGLAYYPLKPEQEGQPQKLWTIEVRLNQ